MGREFKRKEEGFMKKTKDMLARPKKKRFTLQDAAQMLVNEVQKERTPEVELTARIRELELENKVLRHRLAEANTIVRLDDGWGGPLGRSAYA
jgi:hypothetical protein